jgi:hypothetical protein
MTAEGARDLESRLCKVEKSNKILWIAIIVVGLLTPCLSIAWFTFANPLLAFESANHGGTVTASELRLVDRHGNTSAILEVDHYEQDKTGGSKGLARLVMLDANQVPRIQISAAGLSLIDDANVSRSGWGIDKQGVGIFFADQKGKAVVDVRSRDRGSHILLADNDSPAAIGLEISKSGPRITIVDEKGNLIYSTSKP